MHRWPSLVVSGGRGVVKVVSTTHPLPKCMLRYTPPLPKFMLGYTPSYEQTSTCENITFNQLRVRTVIINQSNSPSVFPIAKGPRMNFNVIIDRYLKMILIP